MSWVPSWSGSWPSTTSPTSPEPTSPGSGAVAAADHARSLHRMPGVQGKGQPDVLRLGPVQWRGRAGRLAEPEAELVRPVPGLLRDEVATVAGVRHGLQEGPGGVAGGQLVLAAFAGEQRPQPAGTGRVPAGPTAAVGLALPVRVVVVPVPHVPGRRTHPVDRVQLG